MRSALDQAAFACAALGGISDAKSAYFPIADTASDLENVIKGRTKDIPPDIVSLFRTFKPYKGGNDPIWALNRACNFAKHRALIGVGMAVLKITSRGGYLRGPAAMRVPKWDSEKNEVVFGVVGPGGDFKYDFDFTFFVSFREIETINGAPITPVLATMTGEVERILSAIEVEAKRIGLTG